MPTSMLKKFLVLGTSFSLLHLMIAFGLILIAFDGTFSGEWGEPVSPFIEAIGVLALIMIHPLYLLWTPWMSQNVPNWLETILFVLNSGIWGFLMGWIVCGLTSRCSSQAAPRAIEA